MQELPQRGVSAGGRPSLAVQRRQEVLTAFVELIAERGLERVTLDDVALAAGVQRSTIRHYVGNRTDLVHGAVEVLTARYELLIRESIGHDLSAIAVVDFMFSRRWVENLSSDDRALEVLFQEALRDDETRARLEKMYALLIDQLADAIRESRPDLPRTEAAQTAYQVVCLAEQNVRLQRLGFPWAQSSACHSLARSLLVGDLRGPQ